MKKNYFLIFALLVMASCSEQSVLDDLKNQEKSPVTTRIYGGDGEDDVLGYSCDISSDYLYSKLPVVDNAKAKETFPNAVIQNLGQSGSYDYNAGTTACNYLKSIAENKEVKIKASFFATATTTISSSFKETDALSRNYAYASLERTIKKREYSYALSLEQLRECLSSNFLYDLNNQFNPQSIISKYGTHVYTNIKVGGKITVLYRANIVSTSSETEKKNTVTVGLSGSIGKIFGGSIDTSVSKEEIEKASEKISNAQFVIKAIGGNASIPLMGVVMDAQNNSYSVNIEEWERSVADGNTTTLIDFNPSSLIPIWELVADANKRKLLQTAVENYIINKALTDRIMLYEYFISWTGNHFCTIHIDVMASSGYTRLGEYGYVYSYNAENSTPLYAYKANANNDHTYSLVRNDQHYSRNGYHYMGIECYVPSSSKVSAQELTPIYYYKKVHRNGTVDHYYSKLKLGSYNGGRYGDLSFYVYKNSR